ncbi:MAG: hypothetical protein WBM69_26525, partial [Desulfobacterales bacterium]
MCQPTLLRLFLCRIGFISQIQYIIKKKILDKNKGKLYNQLFEARQEGDYVDFVYFDSDLVEPWVLK